MSRIDLRLAALGLLLASCAICPPVVLETPEGVIRAANKESARKTAELLELYEPLVRDLFHAGRQQFKVDVGLWRPFDLDFEAYATPGHIVIRKVDDELDRRVVHELVHLYAAGDWDALPYMVDEGMAWVVSWALNGPFQATADPPGTERVREALVLEGDAYLSADEAFQTEMTITGIWIVSHVGWKSLVDLVDRAAEQGLERIPPEWFLMALPSPSEPAKCDSHWLDGDATHPVVRQFLEDRRSMTVALPRGGKVTGSIPPGVTELRIIIQP